MKKLLARKNGNIEETLKEHLDNVALICQQFANKFNLGTFGYVIGKYHDIYKSTDKWQQYLLDSINGNANVKSVNHAVESAVYFAYKFANYVKINDSKNLLNSYYISLNIGHCIASHHSGLHDYDSDAINKITFIYFNDFYDKFFRYKSINVATTFKEVMDRTGIDLSGVNYSEADDEIFTSEFYNKLLNEYNYIFDNTNRLYIPMLTSCLVDADRLDAEKVEDVNNIKQNIRSDYDDIFSLKKIYDNHINEMNKFPKASLDINIKRTNLRNQIYLKHNIKRGIVVIQSPTGSGKTEAILCFSINHACFHKMERIIYLAPYTTVVDQTADVFSGIFGHKNVVEHQCDFNAEDKVDKNGNIKGYNGSVEDLKNKNTLVSENWDLPIIVSTTVQFFESLFGYEASSIRKIHNICNSVIVLDEEQQMPLHLLRPNLDVINDLVEKFGCTVVRSTATLPCFDGKIRIKIGNNVYEYIDGYFESINLVDNVDKLNDDFKRVNYINKGIVKYNFIVDELSQDKSVMAIFNKKDTCNKFFDKINKKDSDKYLLTKNLCPSHRKKMIKEIKERLKKGDNISVVATSLVEAGVDFDFDEVLREYNNLYSIKQASGRCNRNGKHKVVDVCFFKLEGEKYGYLSNNIEPLEACFDRKTKQFPTYIKERELDAIFSKKYMEYGINSQLIKKSKDDYEKNFFEKDENNYLGVIGNTLNKLKIFQYRSYGESYHMIEEKNRTPYHILVPYHVDNQDHKFDDLIKESKYHYNRDIQRGLQQYIVDVNKATKDKLINSGYISEFTSCGKNTEIYILNDYRIYDSKVGFNKYAIDNLMNSTIIL